MNFCYEEVNNKILIKDSNNLLLGTGYLFENLSSDIFEQERVHYFLDIDIHEKDEMETIKRNLVEKLVEKAKVSRQKYPLKQARVYHCCFSNDHEALTFYKSIHGFSHDEGMHIVQAEILKLHVLPELKSNYQVVNQSLDDKDSIENFIATHQTIFRGNHYSVEKIKKMQSELGLQNIAIFENGQMVANSLFYFEEVNGEIRGVIEDLFVARDHRQKQLGEYLVAKTLNQMFLLDIKNVQLEVWSSNKKAYALYEKLGFKFLYESESSIGMFI